MEQWRHEPEVRKRGAGALGAFLVLLGMLLGLGGGVWAGTALLDRARPFSAEAAITGGAEESTELRSARPDAPPLPPSPLKKFAAVGADAGVRIGVSGGVGLLGALAGAALTSRLCQTAGLREE